MGHPAITAVAAAAPDKEGVSSLLAINLAVLLARRRRKVLLLDAGRPQACVAWGQARSRARLRPQLKVISVRDTALDRQLHSFDHVIVDTGAAGNRAALHAFAAADVALVARLAGQGDARCLPPLAAAVDSARLSNPGLRVLCVTVGGETAPSFTALQRMRAFALRLGPARVADTVLHLPALRWGMGIPGQCACDLPDSAGAEEMARLLPELGAVPFKASWLSGWRPSVA